MKINRNGRITTGILRPTQHSEHWWRKYPFYRSYYEDHAHKLRRPIQCGEGIRRYHG